MLPIIFVAQEGSNFYGYSLDLKPGKNCMYMYTNVYIHLRGEAFK